MTNAKSSVKLLRRAGLVLIALPEAVTTPVGVACLLTARFLSKKIEADLYKRLQGTLQHYLVHSKRPLKDADDNSSDKKPAKRATRNADRLIPIQAEVKPVAPIAKSSTRSDERLIPVQANAKADPTPTSAQSQRQAEVKAIHHNVDMKWLSRRYALAGNPITDASAPDEQDNHDSGKKSVRHNIDRQTIARRYGITSSPTVKNNATTQEDTPDEAESLILHKIDRQKLAGRFNTEMSKTTDSGSTDNSERGVMHRITSTPLRDYHSSVKW
ncbi:MAG TPA: hypothetical protein VJK47_00040 [Dehalococcoidales bacterium]|nr:hypothetical protein [Dehalococcoidales bacterium]